MHKLLLTIPLIALLSGCATTTGTDQKSLIEQVRIAAVAACGFLPTVATVADIIATGNPIVVTAGTIANAICTAVNQIPPQARRRGAAPVVVAGVVVHGKFVR